MRQYEYTLDPLPTEFRKWIARLKRAAFVVVTLYVLSYFLCGKHESGVDFTGQGKNRKEFTCHYRDFRFDPTLYWPLARLECWLRGPKTKVMIFDESDPEGDGYSYGPYFP